MIIALNFFNFFIKNYRGSTVKEGTRNKLLAGKIRSYEQVFSSHEKLYLHSVEQYFDCFIDISVALR